MYIIFLKVNSVDLREATHDMAINALRQTPPIVRLKVLRDESQFKDEGTWLDLDHMSVFVSVCLSACLSVFMSVCLSRQLLYGTNYFRSNRAL